MKAVVQRVSSAEVRVENNCVGSIGPGLLILLGVQPADSEATAVKLAKRLAKLRIFSDSADKMNLSLLDVGGEALVISQFTLMAQFSSGNRPSYSAAAEPGQAEQLYQIFIRELRNCQITRVETGVFAAKMQVSLVNQGPVTLIVEENPQAARANS